MIKQITISMVCVIIISTAVNSFGQNKELEYQKKPSGRIIQTIDEKSALIIIYSELDLTFPTYERFTNKLEEIKNTSPYQYKLLVDAEYKTIQLRVSANGFIPLTIEVNDLAPKKTIVYSIFEKKPMLNLSKGEFYLTTEPDGATIMIQGQPEFKGATPYHFADRTAMAYRIKLTKPDYYDVDTIMNIEKGKANSLSVKLRSKFGLLKLNTNLTNELLIDGISYDHNSPIQISEGKHNIIVKRKYFKDYYETIEIIGQYNPMIIERKVELEPYKGKLDVITEPIGAEVFLDGRNIGNTPLNKIIDAGHYTLEVKKNKYRTETINFEIKKDETIKRTFGLKKYGLLKIVGTNSAEITLNGEYKGKLPRASNFELPPGEYKIKAELDGYDTEEQSFTLETEIKTIELNLIETEGRFFRWTAFGNQRISSLFNGAEFSVGYFETLLSEELIFTLTGKKENFRETGASVQISLYYTPITINSGIDLSGSSELGFSTVGKDTLSDFYFYTNIGWTPFVLWELIAPSVGIAFNASNFEYRIDTESIRKVSYNSFGLYYEVRIQWRVASRGGFSLKYGYQDLFDKSAYGNFWFINLGFWWIL